MYSHNKIVFMESKIFTKNRNINKFLKNRIDVKKM